jgi:hypothetical protein
MTMIVPGFLISVLTFPGVVVHELAHQLFCMLARVAVFEVCYFRLGNPAGYVLHEKPRKFSQHLLIGIGPLFVNTIIGAVIALPAAIPVLQFGAGSPVDYVLIWLGVSIAMHSFPSTGDAKAIWQAMWQPEVPLILSFICVPVVGAIYLLALGSIFWLDLAYGIAVVAFFPNLMTTLLA